MKRIIVSIFALSLIGGFVACNKVAPTVEPTNSPISTNSVLRESSDKDLYSIMNTIAVGMLHVANNPSYRSIVHKKAKEQFDGDDNVLLKTLQEDGNISNLQKLIADGLAVYSSAIDSKQVSPYSILTNDDEAIDLGVNGYSYTNPDRTLYLQVYVPFIETVDLGQMPIIAILTESDTNLKGYKLNGDGSVTVVDVTESVAQNNLVWVISINESVDASGNANRMITHMDNSGSKTLGTDKDIWINSIYISDKKEGWGAGRADISFISKKLLGCGFSAGPMQATIPFAKISNSKLNTWTLGSGVGGNLCFTWPGATGSLTNNEFLSVLFYETDANTNANHKTVNFSNSLSSVPAPGVYNSSCSSSSSTTVNYFSKESAYGCTNNYPFAYQDINITTTTLTPFYTWNLTGGKFEFSGNLR